LLDGLPGIALTPFLDSINFVKEREKIMSEKPAGAEKKIAAGVCGILLGALGIHKFILGYTKEGLIMLLVSVLTLGILAFVMGIIGLIEGIIYLTKTDEEFVAMYVTGKKGWF
jgi:TM2 domain-containing membrane protein YozV